MELKIKALYHVVKSISSSLDMDDVLNSIAREAAKATPIERLMLETDCPYMSPEPMRKQKVNEPALLVHTAKFLSELKEVELSELAEITTANSERFFGINL